jgi:hypothetical protein
MKEHQLINASTSAEEQEAILCHALWSLDRQAAQQLLREAGDTVTLRLYCARSGGGTTEHRFTISVADVKRILGDAKLRSEREGLAASIFADALRPYSSSPPIIHFSYRPRTSSAIGDNPKEG